MNTLNEELVRQLKGLNSNVTSLNNILMQAGTSGLTLNEKMRSLTSTGSGSGGSGSTLTLADSLLVGSTGKPAFWLKGQSNYYNDLASTTTATTGDAIRSVKDAASGSVTFTSDSEAKSPILSTSDGYSTLYFDGTDKQITSTNYAQQFMTTYGNQVDSDKPFTWIVVFKPELTTNRQDWLRSYSTTNATSETRLSLATSAENNYIEYDHDVDSNLTNLEFQSSVTPNENEINILILISDGERGSVFLHNRDRDLELILTAPIYHNASTSSLDRMRIGGSSVNSAVKGHLYDVVLIPSAFIGLPNIINAYANEYSGLITPTLKTLYSYQTGVAAYAPLQYVAGNCSGNVFPQGRFDVEVVGTVTNENGSAITDKCIRFDGVSGNYAVIQNDGIGSLLSDLCNINEFTLCFDLKVNAAAAEMTAYAIFNNVNAENFLEIQINTSRQAVLKIYDGAGADTTATCTYAIPLDTWVKCFLWSDGTDFFITINNETEGSVSRYTNRANTSTNVRLGTAIPSTRDATVSLSNLIMWNRNLTAQEKTDYINVGTIR